MEFKRPRKIDPNNKGYKPKDKFRVYTLNMVATLAVLELMDQESFMAMYLSGKFNRKYFSHNNWTKFITHRTIAKYDTIYSNMLGKK